MLIRLIIDGSRVGLLSFQRENFINYKRKSGEKLSSWQIASNVNHWSEIEKQTSLNRVWSGTV